MLPVMVSCTAPGTKGDEQWSEIHYRRPWTGQDCTETADGRYVYIAGAGLSGDVRLTSDASHAEEFVWQDMLYNRCMLLSLKTQRYIGKHPTDGSPYSADFQGADAGMKNGCVFSWEVVE